MMLKVLFKTNSNFTGIFIMHSDSGQTSQTPDANKTAKVAENYSLSKIAIVMENSASQCL